MKSFLHSIGIASLAIASFSPKPAAAFQPAPPEIPGPDLRGGSYLGIGVQEIDSERAKAIGLREDRGVEVTRIAEDSPAAKAGFKTGDVVLEYNGQRVEGVEQLMRMVRETPVGREVKITVYRSGATHNLVLVTARRKIPPRDLEWGAIPGANLPTIRIPNVPSVNLTWRNASLGVEAESLSPQLAEYFGVREGVLVRSVVKGSAADKAGIKAGDVIVRLNESKVSAPQEITALGKKNVSVHLVRDRREMTIQVALDNQNAGAGSQVKP